VVGWIVLARRVVGILPIAVLRFVDGEPMTDVIFEALDDEGGAVEVVVYDLSVCPGSVFIEGG